MQFATCDQPQDEEIEGLSDEIDDDEVDDDDEGDDYIGNPRRLRNDAFAPKGCRGM